MLNFFDSTGYAGVHVLLVITSREKPTGASKDCSFVVAEQMTSVCPHNFQFFFLGGLVVGGLYLEPPASSAMIIFPVSQIRLTHSNECVQYGT